MTACVGIVKRENVFSFFWGSLCYFFFFLMIAFGNLSRIGLSLPLEDSLPLTEAFLYFFSLFAFFFQKKRTSEILFLSSFFILLTLSYLHGVFLWGGSLISLGYCLRLFGMVLSGVVIGKHFYLQCGSDVRKGLSLLLVPYQFSLLLGFLIFFLFPDSSHLWVFLDRLGVTFHGDPHLRRFVSVYFDPNFYSVIAGIPFLATLLLWKKRFFSFFWASLIFLSILLTWSRSGLATICALGIFLLFYRYLEKRVFPIHYVIGVIVTIFSTIFILYLFSFSEDWGLFFQRLIDFMSDDSAQARMVSWQQGLSYLASYPLSGMGYNFLAEEFQRETGASGVDSSLLLMGITFGLIVSLFVLFLFLLYWIREKQSIKGRAPFLFRMFMVYSGYLFFVVAFASFFNNILFYPFWLIPMIVIFKYIHEVKKEDFT